MTTLLLIRHGETDWNEEGRLQGQQDIPLNARGLEQARRTAAGLKDACRSAGDAPAGAISAIYTSDLRRAYQTAQAIGDALGLPLHTDPRLREVRLGHWEGRLARELTETDDERFAERIKYPAAVAPPGGETAQQVQARLLAAVDAICARHPRQTVVVVTHGFAVAVLLSAFRGIPLEQVWDLIPTNGQIHVIEKSALPTGRRKPARKCL